MTVAPTSGMVIVTLILMALMFLCPLWGGNIANYFIAKLNPDYKIKSIPHTSVILLFVNIASFIIIGILHDDISQKFYVLYYGCIFLNPFFIYLCAYHKQKTFTSIRQSIFISSLMSIITGITGICVFTATFLIFKVV